MSNKNLFARSLFAVGIISLGLIFTMDAFGQTGGRSRRRKLRKPQVKQAVIILDDEARMSLVKTAKENPRKPLAAQTSPNTATGTPRINKPFLEDENGNGDFDDAGERNAAGSRRSASTADSLHKNESIKQIKPFIGGSTDGTGIRTKPKTPVVRRRAAGKKPR